MDERTERRILEKAQYVRDAVEVLAEKRDALSFEEYRSDRASKAIVGRIVDAHDWTIDLDEREEGGVMFEIADVDAERRRSERQIGKTGTSSASNFAGRAAAAPGRQSSRYSRRNCST